MSVDAATRDRHAWHNANLRARIASGGPGESIQLRLAAMNCGHLDCRPRPTNA